MSGLIYVNSVDWCATAKLLAPVQRVADIAFGGGVVDIDSIDKAHGWTIAIEPATGRMIWHIKMPTPMIAALTPTAGGVVFTYALDGYFRRSIVRPARRFITTTLYVRKI
jgi:alcohol dehydrogenase (cytochrome c)